MISESLEDTLAAYNDQECSSGRPSYQFQFINLAVLQGSKFTPPNRPSDYFKAICFVFVLFCFAYEKSVTTEMGILFVNFFHASVFFPK